MSTSDEQSPNLQRRRFLAVSAAAAGVTLAPGVMMFEVAQARSPSEAASRDVRWGMLIDSNKCKTGCDDCVSACAKENGWANDTAPLAQKPQWIRKVNLTHKTTGHQASLPMMCQHCAEPPCVDVCPTGASMKRADGIVLVDKHICIGCRYCMMACPYKARSFVHEIVDHEDAYMPRGMGTVESCTMCVHRVDKGEMPACVESCKEQAIMFGDLNDPNSAISKRLKEYPSRQVRADLKLNTGVRYEGI
ncbi:MAG: 4Fe-4S dicluster domain-containing protein [Gammaproteobacteria bacterium]|nr:4Fe-4S dicluster domain-containing protein [Gammaproteobacteria bacterium]